MSANPVVRIHTTIYPFSHMLYKYFIFERLNGPAHCYAIKNHKRLTRFSDLLARNFEPARLSNLGFHAVRLTFEHYETQEYCLQLTRKSEKSSTQAAILSNSS